MSVRASLVGYSAFTDVICEVVIGAAYGAAPYFNVPVMVKLLIFFHDYERFYSRVVRVFNGVNLRVHIFPDISAVVAFA
jgi:hypothetical protein